MSNHLYKILVVDDNPDIHEDFKKILMPSQFSKVKEDFQKIKSELFEEASLPKDALSYEIHSAYQGKEAISLIESSIKEKTPYALIFLDVLMPPGINGIETAKEIWNHDPFVQIVICTAYSDYSWNSIVQELGVNDNFLILKKPFESIEIRQLAACLTEKWRLGNEAGHKFDRLYSDVFREMEKLKSMFDKYEDKGK